MTTALQTQNKPKRKAGRPTTITEAKVKALLEVVAAGNYTSTALQLVELAQGTFYRWLEWGERDEAACVGSLYCELWVGLKRVEAQAEAAMVAKVREAANGGQLIETTSGTRRDGSEWETKKYAQPQWLAAITFLERRHPDRWGRKDRRRDEESDSKPIQITHVEVILNQTDKPPIIEGETIPHLNNTT